jgi:hypothetical protein
MLDAINAAMGISGITNTAHRGVISGLNSDLIKQIQDLAQAGAVANDLGASGLGYGNKLALDYTFSQGQELAGVTNPYNEPGDAQTVPSVALQNSAVKATQFLANGFGYGIKQPIWEQKNGMAMA